MGYERLVVAFQPHTYSRTAKLFERFVEELKIPDVAILAEIFAAREQNTLGISSADLVPQYPRRCVLLHPGQGGGGSAAGGPARRLDPHRRRR